MAATAAAAAAKADIDAAEAGAGEAEDVAAAGGGSAMDVDGETHKEDDNWKQTKEKEGANNSDGEDAEAVFKETDVGGGIMAALQFSKRRGFLDEKELERQKDFEKRKKAQTSGKAKSDASSSSSSSSYGRSAGRRDDRGGNAYSSSSSGDVFTKEGYTPNFNLEHRDDSGRLLTDAKEQFRYISHKFHGKTSGRLKTEKRLIKLAEEERSRKMEAGDTPLNMTDMMRRKMEETGSAHIVMSGSGSGSNATVKKKSKRGK